MNVRHRNLHSSVRRRNYAVVIFIIQATGCLKWFRKFLVPNTFTLEISSGTSDGHLSTAFD